MSQAGRYITGGPTPGGDVLTLEGDLGGPVGPDMSGNINVIADNASVNAGSSVLIVGNPGTNTLTLNVTDVNNGTLIGLNAGNLTISGINNTGVGHLVLNALTSGANNTALGADAATLITSSSGNTAVGSGSLSSYVTGTGQNTALGLDALRDLASGSANTAIGYQAMEGSSSNTNSVAVGYQSLRLGTGVGNTSLGAQAGTALTTGAANTMVGFQSGLNLTTGHTNIFVGNLAGQNITNSGNNICIGSGGVLADSGAIRIGASGIHTSAFMQGIAGVTPPGTLNMVTVDTGTGQLGSTALPSFSGIDQVTGDLGTPVTPTGGNIDIITGVASNNAGSTFAFSGSGSILTLDASDSDENTCFGFNAGNTSTVAIQNTCFGYNAGSSLAGGSISAASYNVFIGNGAGENVNGSTPAQGSYHTAVGSLALNQATTSEGNTAIGNSSFYALTTGSFNTGVGVNTGCNGTNGVTTGQRNTLIGHFAGSNYRSSESNNILIGAAVNGTLGESNVIRIGHSTNTTTYIAGITGNTVSNARMVTINSSTGQLGEQAIPTGMIPWTVVTGASQAMAVNNGYIANNAGTINFSLPASSAVGDIIRITGINNATGWQITQGAGQQIFFGTANTTAGAGGSITSSATRDSIEIVCVVADTIWNVLSVIGNPTIV